MIHSLSSEGFFLRPLSNADLDALYVFKNNPQTAALLGGFSTGYTREDLRDWYEFHRKHHGEALWSIAAVPKAPIGFTGNLLAKFDGDCLGHVGLYNIDHRARSAEFAIMIGAPNARGKGLGKACTLFILNYGFNQLNLNRIHLSVLANNTIALQLYKKAGFTEEGTQRQAQYKDGQYLDVVLMSILRSEYEAQS